MRDVRRRRFDSCAALVVVGVLMATSTACQKPERVNVPTDAKMPTVLNDSLKFADFPDGSAPEFFAGPTKVSPEFIADDPGAKFRIKDGKLTVEPTQPRQTASYFSTPDLGAPIVRIGARWTFNPRGGTKDGAMCLLVSNEVIRPPFPVHLCNTPYKWAYGVWPAQQEGESEKLEYLQEGVFDPPLKEDGTTVYETDVALDGDRALVTLPDGQRITIRDRRIAEWAGRIATFEAFAKNGVTDSAAAFTEIWVGRGSPG
jgi:hypothetical protein